MWFERFDIIAIVLSKGQLPSTWWRFASPYPFLAYFVSIFGDPLGC